MAALRRAWTEENAGAPIEDDGFEQRFDEWLEREQHQRVIWLGFVEDEPVGMLNLLVFTRMPRPGERARPVGLPRELLRPPEHRNSGLGARLLATCTAYADEQRLRPGGAQPEHPVRAVLRPRRLRARHVAHGP